MGRALPSFPNTEHRTPAPAVQRLPSRGCQEETGGATLGAFSETVVSIGDDDSRRFKAQCEPNEAE